MARPKKTIVQTSDKVQEKSTAEVGIKEDPITTAQNKLRAAGYFVGVEGQLDMLTAASIRIYNKLNKDKIEI